MKKLLLVLILIPLQILAELPPQARVSLDAVDTNRLVIRFKDSAQSMRSSANAGLAASKIMQELGYGADILNTEVLLDPSDNKSRASALSGLKKIAYVNLSAHQSSRRVLEDLNAHADIDVAHFAFKPVKPPIADIAPTTPNFSSQQGYRRAAPTGMDSVYAYTQPGGKGENIAIVDIEYKWVTRHEDLPISRSSFILNHVPGPYDKNHGTAVVGILAGGKNRFGVKGLAPRSTVLLAKPFLPNGSYSIATAIVEAVNNTLPGDVILLEQQYGGGLSPCRCGDACTFYTPVEFGVDVFTAIQNATAAGRVIVEAAGNGGQDLDDPAYAGYFDFIGHYSGAIMVGAIDSGSRVGHCYSNAGSRIDVSSWGDSVVTSGYGDLFNPLAGQRGQKRQQYTGFFSGTSSASALIAGASASLQGFALAHSVSISPYDLMVYFRSTGTAAADTSDFGYMPDLRAAIEQIKIDNGL